MNRFINKNEKIALIGCGYWGTIITKTLYSMGIKDIFVFDLNNKNSQTLKKKFININIVQNYEEILNNSSIKNIFFATPPSINFILVKKAILKKKNIFLEKPGVTKLSEITILKKMSKNKKVVVMFGYVYCYNDYINYLKKLIKKKTLGNLLYIKFQRQNLGPIRNDVNVAEDLSSHDLSIILYIFKKMPKVISHIKYSILKKNIADISNLHMKLNKIFIDINNSWISPIKVRKISFVGTKKMLLFDEMNLSQPIKIYNKYVKFPKIEDFNKEFFNSKALIYKGNIFSPKIKMNPSLTNEITKFFKIIHTKEKNLTGFTFSTKILNFLKSI